jgi:O-antigen/teichoic acid export membrane protein
MSLALAVGRRRALVIGTWWGFAVNLVANLAMIPFLGATGAAVASLLGYGISALVVGRVATSGTKSFRRSSFSLTGRLAAPTLLAAILGRVTHIPIAADACAITVAYMLGIAILLPIPERRRLISAARSRLNRVAKAVESD